MALAVNSDKEEALDYELKGQVALVTGGAAGIGRAAALAFARDGAKVVVSDVNVAGGEETLRLLRDAGGEGIFVTADVSKAADVKSLTAAAVERFGRIDCAFNNAGVEGDTAPTADCSEQNWDRVLSINLRGIWLCMKHEIPQMLRQGRGAIVNMSSIAGLVGFGGLPAYVASKHGVVGLTKTAALEYATQGIRINAVCPGVIHTEMIDRITAGDPAAVAQFTEMEPVKRMGTPEEVAAAVLWLCSGAASFVTGHTMVVDGGTVAQ
jgi:NAD(P)-dependent dehydrogenase (short-subunit alcohol dehydrogenase family)